jgi:hypothetical protein
MEKIPCYESTEEILFREKLREVTTTLTLLESVISTTTKPSEYRQLIKLLTF